jgi:hypothetical protein
MKKYYAILGIVLIVAAGVFALTQEKASGQFTPNPICYLNGSRATSTPTFLTTAGSAATLVCFTDGASSVDLNLSLTASSTATALTWKQYFADGRESNTGDCYSTANCNWFGEDAATTSSLTVTHASTTLTHSWKPDVTTNVTKNVLVSPVASRYFRVDFTVTGANGSVWVQGVGKTEF